MFPRDRRLRRHRDIGALLRRGRIVKGPGLALRMGLTPLAMPRVTVVVSTAVAKRAVVRNRLKRQLRHALAAELSGVRGGVDLMLTTRRELLDTPATIRRQLVHELLCRARLISP